MACLNTSAEILRKNCILLDNHNNIITPKKMNSHIIISCNISSFPNFPHLFLKMSFYSGLFFQQYQNKVYTLYLELFLGFVYLQHSLYLFFSITSPQEFI